MFDFNFGMLFGPNLVSGARALMEVVTLDPDRNIDQLTHTTGILTPRARMARQSNTRPNLAVWQAGTKVIIAIGGLWEHNEFYRYLEGAERPVSVDWPGALVNGMTVRYVNSVQAGVLEAFDGNVDQVWLFGHSMGGTMAHLLGYNIAKQKAGVSVSVATFGMPRFCNAEGAALFRNQYQIRFTNQGDAIPFMPPRLGEFPVAAAFLPGASLWRYGQCVDMGNHHLLAPNGDVLDPRQAVGFATPSQWLMMAVADQMLRDHSPHLMLEYQIRVARAFAGVQAPIMPPANAIRILPNRNHHETMTRQEVDERARSLRVETDRPALLPDWVRVPNRRIKIRKVLHSYEVLLDGETFYLADRKNDAIAVARSLRIFMKQYLQRPGRFNRRGDILAAFRGEVPGRQVPQAIGGVAGVVQG